MQAPAEMLNVLAAINAGQVQEHFVNGILLDAGGDLLQGGHHALRHTVVYVEWISTGINRQSGCYKQILTFQIISSIQSANARTAGERKR